MTVTQMKEDFWHKLLAQIKTTLLIEPAASLLSWIRLSILK